MQVIDDADSAVIPPARPVDMRPDSEEKYQYLANREDRPTVESKRRAADHVLRPFLLAAIDDISLTCQLGFH
jgi:hypothetical protein